MSDTPNKGYEVVRDENGDQIGIALTGSDEEFEPVLDIIQDDERAARALIDLVEASNGEQDTGGQYRV